MILSGPAIFSLVIFVIALIIIGFILLTRSLLTGAPFVSVDADKILLQKITFSVIAWIAYFYLIYQRFSSNVFGKSSCS